MSYQKNIDSFFALVRAGLWEDSQKFRLLEGSSVATRQAEGLEFRDSVDWEEVYRLAKEQSVLGLVLAGIERMKSFWTSQAATPGAKVQGVQEVHGPDKMTLLQWIGEVQMLEQQNKAMNQFIGELVDKMRDAGIYTILVKGQGIAQCYERPLWRSCGDVDLFLSDDNYERAKAYLTPLAADVSKEYVREKHLGMTIDMQTVELHGRLYCGLSSRIEKEMDDVYQDTFYGGNARSWQNGSVQVFLLSVENDAFYVFTHILQHFYKEGIGLRQICDWCRLLWTYRGKMDVKKLETRLERARLMTAWRAFGAFAVGYLGMPPEAMPFYSADAKWKRKADRICAFILEVGNFGHNRDMSYFSKYPYLVRKVCSMERRCGDLFRHARIFPLDSLRFFPRIMFNGLRSAVRGE